MALGQPVVDSSRPWQVEVSCCCAHVRHCVGTKQSHWSVQRQDNLALMCSLPSSIGVVMTDWSAHFWGTASVILSACLSAGGTAAAATVPCRVC